MFVCLLAFLLFACTLLPPCFILQEFRNWVLKFVVHNPRISLSLLFLLFFSLPFSLFFRFFSSLQSSQILFSSTSTEIHWVSILNSFVLVLLLLALLSIILIRILRNDLARYLDMDEGGRRGADTDDSGWKQVHSDVFRPPRWLMLISAALGTGAQVRKQGWTRLLPSSVVCFLCLSCFFSSLRQYSSALAGFAWFLLGFFGSQGSVFLCLVCSVLLCLFSCLLRSSVCFCLLCLVLSILAHGAPSTALSSLSMSSLHV